MKNSNTSIPSEAYAHARQLTNSNIEFYRQQGFLIVHGLITPLEVNEIKNEAVRIFKGKNGNVEGIQPLTGNEADMEVLIKYNAIHFPHKISETIFNYLKHPSLAEVLSQLISPNVKGIQSMLFVKGPGKPGQSWHQDEYYIPTRDKSLTGVWIAIDDATVENGCLWVIPGSHKAGYIQKRVKYSGNEYADVDICDMAPYSAADEVPVVIPSGSVLFFNGYLLHSSLRNKTTNNFRMSLVNHYMSAESMLPWDNDGRFEHTEDMRDITLVAGTDPYAHKGTVNLLQPFLRYDVLTHKADAELMK